MKFQRTIIIVITCVLTLISSHLIAQVKITDGSVLTMDPNSLLELESNNKGFLPPRVIINSLSSVSPLTGTVPSGMLVYSSGGTVTDGYYFWDGSRWRPFSTGAGGVNLISKSADATLTKTETYIVASNDITLTLPPITIDDNGLSISVNNVGSHLDLITVLGSGSSTINGAPDAKLSRWMGFNFIASQGNWIIKNSINRSDDVFDVSETSSWQTIPEIVEFLNAHMTAPALVRLGGERFEIPATQTISLPYPVTFEGLSYGVTTIAPASGFTGGLFSCESEAYFKKLIFESTYGSTGGHDAIRLTGSGKYYEIKDCSLKGFNRGVVITNDCESWIFECDFADNISSGIELAAGISSGLTFKTAESDFINCGHGINLVSGVNAVVSVQNCGFYLSSGGQFGLTYVPATFTTPSSMFFTNNYWNNTGIFINGFDFTRTDGRDANMSIENNAGIENKNPKCKINVVNNASTTTLTTANSWYKASWTNTSNTTVNWFLNNNLIRYQPTNPRDILIILCGNISVNGASRTITVGIVKNGITTTRYGETTLRTATANQAYQYSTTVYIQNVLKNDTFEVYVTSTNGGDVVTFQDVNIFVNAQ
jgi:hypothetical protein